MLLVLFCALAVSGCSVLPYAITRTAARQRDKARTSALVANTAWRRSVKRTDSGYLIEWESAEAFPKARPGTSWIGIEKICDGSAREPSDWTLRGSDGKSTGLLLRVGKVTSGMARERSISEAVLLERLRPSLLGDDEEVRWLARLDGAAARIAVQWVVKEDAAMSSVRPCAIRWTRVEEALVLESSAAAASLSSTVPAKAALEQAARAAGLIGQPEYDLVRLHQIALSYDASTPLPHSLSPALARYLREQRLAELSALPDAQKRACSLGKRQALFARTLSLWQGDSTIPQALRSICN